MKKSFLFGLSALFLSAVILISCLNEPGLDSKQSRSSGRLTLTEARETFERHFISNAETRSGSESEGDILVTFDYTPLWNSADLKHDDYSSMMSVPVLTNRMISVGYFGNGGDKPERVAAVTQELHIVKNLDLGVTIPTVKTVIPLNGRSMRPNMRALEIHDYATSRHELIIYQTLDGRRINMQLFEDGRETVHAFIGEGAESYNDKMSRIHAALEGYSLIINHVIRVGTRGGEGDGTRCALCGGMIYPGDYHEGCGPEIRYCINCEYRIPYGETHFQCNDECHICGKWYLIKNGHQCSTEYCYTCGNTYYGPSYNHTCQTRTCQTCRQEYIGSPNYHAGCPGLFCVICGTAPCRQVCSQCGTPHCTTNHGGGGNGDPEQPLYYTINLIASPVAGGIVSGSGSYLRGVVTTISASKNSGYQFVNWTGTSAISTNTFTVTVNSNMSLIANFRLCHSTNKANPVRNMTILPTASGNTDNGDYLGRNGGHKGIDVGVSGEPIYAMFDGTVSRVTNTWDSNLLWKNYTDQSPSAKTGNRVEYTSVVNGQTIYIQCWHMSTVETGISAGRQITAGTLLGYVGQTGNATDTGSGGPHLHLQIKSNNSSGTILNPHDYIYSNYSRNNGKLQNNGKPNNDC